MSFNPVAVGDQVIVEDQHKAPEIRTVAAVTPSGQFRVDGIKGLFRVRRYRSEATLTGTGKYGGGTRAVNYTDDYFRRKLEGFNEWKADQDQKHADRDARRREIEARDEERRAAVLATINIPGHRIANLPAGQRVYQFPDLIDRGDREPGVCRFTTVVVRDYEDHDWDNHGIKARFYLADFTTWRGSERFGRGFYTGDIDRKRTEIEAVVDALVVAIFELG